MVTEGEAHDMSQQLIRIPSNHNGAVFTCWNLTKCPNDVVVVEDETDTTGPCRDCGNRAKKGCGFRRCRTCCRSRAFPCSTHVTSTWVPAARRRERREAAGSSGSSSASKRPRLLDSHTAASHSNTSISNDAISALKSFDATSTHQDAILKQSLPSKVHAPAVFKCHRVTAIGNGEVEIAYQVTVRISGHVFKGFLYDHGVDEKNGDYSSSSPIVVVSTPNPSSTS